MSIEQSYSYRDYGLVNITMTEDAAYRFNEALRYAEAIVHNQAESNQAPANRQKIRNHGEWLRWGMGRLDQARRGDNE